MYVFMIVMYAGILFLIAALSFGFLSWLIYQKNKKSKQLKKFILGAGYPCNSFNPLYILSIYIF